jgi:putative ABC transport system permease protein
MSRKPELLGLALETVLRQPKRSALTVLGLTIGVGAFIAMVSFGQGARRSVLAQFEALGSNLLKIQSTPTAGGKPPAPLTSADVRALERGSTSIAAVLPVLRNTIGVSRGRAQRATVVYGVQPRFTALHAWQFYAGGMFDAYDVEQAAKVCVLGDSPARALFGDADPLGQTVTIAGVLPCRVIGVLLAKGYATSGSDLDDLILMPLTTFSSYLSEREGFSYLEVEPASPDLLGVARLEISAILRRAHGLATAETDDFTISSPLDVIRAVNTTTNILSGLLAGIAAVSLLVGGIGIMNIQIVSVAERTEEIGIRAAIGAAPRDILNQFLSEAAMLSVLGVLAGVLFGIVVASLVAHWMGWPRVISPTGILVAVGFGMTVGMAFGYLPARRAANLDPIHALRHE